MPDTACAWPIQGEWHQQAVPWAPVLPTTSSLLETPWPTRRDSVWRYAPLRQLSTQDWQWPVLQPSPPFIPEAVSVITAAMSQGVWLDQFRTTSLPEGMVLAHTGLLTGQCVGSMMGGATGLRDDLLAQCHRQFSTPGFYIHVPAGLHVTLPLYLYSHYSDMPSSMLHPRHVVVLGEGASLDIVHVITGDDHLYWSNEHWAITLQKNARLTHTTWQNHGAQAQSTVHRHVAQDSASSYVSCALQKGGAMVHEIYDVHLNGEQASCDVRGVSQLTDRQYVDHQVFVHHEADHTSSRQFFKGVVDGAAHSVFHGAVHVPVGVKAIEAHQMNRHILLSPFAKAHSQPDLEILADDVVCTHGSSIGQMHPDDLYYCQSRGLSLLEAQRLLMRAFILDVWSHLDIPASILFGYDTFFDQTQEDMS